MKTVYYPPSKKQNRFTTPLVRILIIINVTVFCLQAFIFPNRELETLFALWPPFESNFRPWQFISYGFLHGHTVHLLLNMFVLWMFGTSVERVWGTRRLLFFYLICLIGSATVHLVVTTYLSADIRHMIGASGAIYGVFAAFAVLFPNVRVVFILFPVPTKVKWFFLFILAFELWAGTSEIFYMFANYAHVGGLIIGLVLGLLWCKRGYHLDKSS